MTRSDRVATLEEAKAAISKSWDAWKAWANLEEMPLGRVTEGNAMLVTVAGDGAYREAPTTPPRLRWRR